MMVTHFALDFGFWCKCSDGIDDAHVDRARPDQHVGNLARLLAGVRLRDQQIIDIDTEAFSILGVERVFSVAESCSTA